jgi:GNAT superfamily N-acetyltransferase
MTPLTVRPASTSDIPVVVALLNEASTWLAAIGSNQWQYPPRTARIAAGVEAGTVWMAVCDKLTVGTITLDDYADPEFWVPEDHPHDALYVHRTVITRAAAGQRIGAALLNWASLRAHAADRTWLRLDAWAANTRLHSYYIAQGWTHVRTVHLPHRGSGALFQRRAGTTTPGTPEIVERPNLAPSL